MNDQSDLASRRILSVTEEELSRIILDIHDGPVQYLFAALSLLARLQGDLKRESASPETLERLNKAAELVESSLREIKTFLGTFRPPEFHRRSLAWIIQGVVIQHEEWTGQTVQTRIRPLPEQTALPVKIALYRIVQEALSNTYRHAGVDSIALAVWQEEGVICLEVSDKGRGFDPPPLTGPDHGGQAVRAKYGPEFYAKIGRKGGETVKEKRGP